jgi:hypothetical protein
MIMKINCPRLSSPLLVKHDTASLMMQQAII